MNPDNKRGWLDDPRHVTWLYRGLWGAGVALLLIDFFVHRHAEVGFDGLLDFYGLYGFVACVVLVLAAKLVLRRAVMRPEDYYDDR
jgi:hypothetical protein